MSSSKIVRHLLVLSCSDRKREELSPCSAMDLYDGPAFRILRKLRREGRFPVNLDVFIVSGKYGLISSESVIEYYDRTIDEEVVLSTMSREKMSTLLDDGYQSTFVNMGKKYMGYFNDLLAEAISANGRIGQKNSQMRHWILGL